jgi:hypothetical protein
MAKYQFYSAPFHKRRSLIRANEYFTCVSGKGLSKFQPDKTGETRSGSRIVMIAPQTTGAFCDTVGEKVLMPPFDPKKGDKIKK